MPGYGGRREHRGDATPGDRGAQGLRPARRASHRGRRHRDGKLALIVSKADDPDATLAELPLTTDEAGALANLLGAPQLVAQLGEEQRDLPGIRTGRLPIATGSPFDGRTLGETALRSRAGVSVVAVMRAGPGAPQPAAGLHADRGRPA